MHAHGQQHCQIGRTLLGNARSGSCIARSPVRDRPSWYVDRTLSMYSDAPAEGCAGGDMPGHALTGRVRARAGVPIRVREWECVDATRQNDGRDVTDVT